MKRDGMMATVLEKIVREVDEADWEVIVLATPRLSREAQSCEHHCAATGGAGAARASGGGGGLWRGKPCCAEEGEHGS